MEKIKIGVSQCLLGEKVRYDGGHQWDHCVTDTLGRYFKFVPVCPEVEYGLGIPREATRLIGEPESPRLVSIHTGVDHTDGMLAWARKRLDGLAKENLCGYVFKSRSPSCGMKGVNVYGPEGDAAAGGTGIFAGLFMKHFPFLPVTEEKCLHDADLRKKILREFLHTAGGLCKILQFYNFGREV